MYVYLSVHHMCAGMSKNQKRTSDSPELELEVVSHPMWALGMKLVRSCERILLTTKPSLHPVSVFLTEIGMVLMKYLAIK